MIKFIDVTGKTEDEAIQSALAQLKMDRDDVSVEILERAKAGFLGIGSAPARVRVSYDDGKAEEVKPVEKPAAPKPEKKSNVGMILVIFALAGAAGAAYYYIKFVKGRKPKDEDMDFFDDEGYEEEPYINEDEEPQIAEDAETEGDED